MKKIVGIILTIVMLFTLSICLVGCDIDITTTSNGSKQDVTNTKKSANTIQANYTCYPFYHVMRPIKRTLPSNLTVLLYQYPSNIHKSHHTTHVSGSDRRHCLLARR